LTGEEGGEKMKEKRKAETKEREKSGRLVETMWTAVPPNNLREREHTGSTSGNSKKNLLNLLDLVALIPE
jgi:hypothetical protein